MVLLVKRNLRSTQNAVILTKGIKSTYGQGGITDLTEPAFFTDDTQMSVAIAEALIRAGDRDLEIIMQAVSGKGEANTS